MALAGCVLPLMFVSTQTVIQDEAIKVAQRQALAQSALASALPTPAPETPSPSPTPEGTPTPEPTPSDQTSLSGVVSRRGLPAPNRTIYLKDLTDPATAAQVVKTNAAGVYAFKVRHHHTYQVIYDVTAALLGTTAERDQFYRDFQRHEEIQAFESVPLAIAVDPRRLDLDLAWNSEQFTPEDGAVLHAPRPGAYALEVDVSTYEGAFEYELFLEGPNDEDFHEISNSPDFPGLILAVPSYGFADEYDYHVLAHITTGTVRSPRLAFSLREQSAP